MSRILIIEDEEAIAELEKDYLELSGFEVVISNRGDQGLEKAMKEAFDLIILDLMLPEVDGFEICRQVREEKNTPIIMVSAKKDDIDKIRGLGLGADDYMTKPYATKELIARIHSALRRHEEPKIIVDPAFTIGDLSIYPERHEVRASDEVVDLTKKEFDLLLFLAKNKNRVLKREEILEKVWGYGYAGKTNIVDVYVRYLRSKIDEKVGKKYIHTVRGIGYVARD